MLKHTSELPIISVNTFRNPHGDAVHDKLRLTPARPTRKSKASSSAWKTSTRHAHEAQRSSAPAAGGDKAVTCLTLRWTQCASARSGRSQFAVQSRPVPSQYVIFPSAGPPDPALAKPDNQKRIASGCQVSLAEQ
jgi:hypothetical protein